MANEEKLYTIDEARQVIKDERCAMVGHLLAPVEGAPERMRCDYCEKTFNLVPAPAVPGTPRAPVTPGTAATAKTTGSR